MKKAEFIKIVSKIEDTFEDEFRAEFNSPELIWEALIKQLTIPVVVKSLPQDNFCIVCNLPTDGEKCYSKRCPVYWLCFTTRLLTYYAFSHLKKSFLNFNRKYQ